MLEYLRHKLLPRKKLMKRLDARVRRSKLDSVRSATLARERVKKILARPTYAGRYDIGSYRDDFRPELVYALMYLQKHSPEDERAMIQWAWTKRRDYLDQTERKHVEARIAALSI